MFSNEPLLKDPEHLGPCFVHSVSTPLTWFVKGFLRRGVNPVTGRAWVVTDTIPGPRVVQVSLFWGVCRQSLAFFRNRVSRGGKCGVRGYLVTSVRGRNEVWQEFRTSDAQRERVRV